ncbi:MAG: aminoacyl-tRNA hydrolase [Planctomycetes bacterium]|nr:aminoacyl-tRNA hydrolase [Planctomycetota bacterium]
MKLIVGLGNPGPEYARTRHNAGFMVLDRLVTRCGVGGFDSARTRFHAQMHEAVVAGQRAVLLEPNTFMNRSGLAVGEAVTFFKIEPAADLLIIVDDLALPCGKIRLRAEGSAGGHNGLADVQRALGSIAYPRLRVGIDARGLAPQKDYVLSRFSSDQQPKIDAALNDACDAIETWARDGIAKAMTKFNNAE